MIGQQGSLGVSPAELLAAKNMASGKSDMNKEISLGGDLTRLMLAAMQLKKSQAELEKAKLTRGANPQTTVAQDVQKGIAQLQGQAPQQAPQPQGQPQGQPQQMAQMDSGIGGLPAGAIDNEDAFAGGGIVAFAAGGIRESGDDKISPEVQAVRDEEMKQLKIAEYARSTPELQALMGKEMRNAGINTAGIASIAPTAARPENIARQTVDNIRKLEAELQGRMVHPDQRNALLSELDANKKILSSLPNVVAQGNPDSIASRALGLASGAAPTNAPRGDAVEGDPLAATGIAAITAAAGVPPAVFRSNRVPAAAGVPPAGVPPAGVPPAGVPPAGTPSLLSRGLGALRGIAASPYTAGAGLLLESSEAGRGSDIVPNKPAGRPPTPREIDELLKSGKISDAEAREMLKKLSVVPAVPKQKSSGRDMDGQNKYSPPGFVPNINSQPESGDSAEPVQPDLMSSIQKYFEDKVTDLRANPPKTMEQYQASNKALAKEMGVDPESVKQFFDKQAASITEQATQARQDRDVNLWMSAAKSFFAIAKSTSPNAFVNIAAGLGVGTKEATEALNEYSKQNFAINKAKAELAKLELTDKRGRFDKRVEGDMKYQKDVLDRHQNQLDEVFVKLYQIAVTSKDAADKRETTSTYNDAQLSLARDRLIELQKSNSDRQQQRAIDSLSRNPAYKTAVENSFPGKDLSKLTPERQAFIMRNRVIKIQLETEAHTRESGGRTEPNRPSGPDPSKIGQFDK